MSKGSEQNLLTRYSRICRKHVQNYFGVSTPFRPSPEHEMICVYMLSGEKAASVSRGEVVSAQSDTVEALKRHLGKKAGNARLPKPSNLVAFL